VELYSPFGIPRDRLVRTRRLTKLVIDPLRDYFAGELQADAARFERLILIHGCEPPESNDITSLVIAHSSLFSEVHSFDPRVLAACPGSRRFCFGSSWIIDQDVPDADRFSADKDFEVSFIRSGKTQFPGHRFRFEIDRVLAQPFPFRLNYPRAWIPEKHPLFTRAMFHIAAENSRHVNYFTEKIVDCFVSYTVPIYWGCPNIGDDFDQDGIICFESADELAAILARLRPDDFRSRLGALRENRARALVSYAFFFRRVNRLLQDGDEAA